jgi:hypothetical protein
MSSISSSRKGRPNEARDSDNILLTGNFRATIRDWQKSWPNPPSDELAYRRLDEQQPDEFTLTVDCMNKAYEAESIALVDRQIPAETKIKRGPVDTYRVTLDAGRQRLLDRHIVIAAGELTVDVTEAVEATNEQVDAALSWTPEPPKPAPAPKPVFTRIPRTPDVQASYLGFQISRDERAIRTLGRFSWAAFNLSSPQVVGRVSVSLTIPPLSEPKPKLLIFDAFGRPVLAVELSSNAVQFDQVQLPSGDYLAILDSPNAIEGYGSRQPHAGVVSELAETPILDDLPRKSDATFPRVSFEA